MAIQRASSSEPGKASPTLRLLRTLARRAARVTSWPGKTRSVPDASFQAQARKVPGFLAAVVVVGSGAATACSPSPLPPLSCSVTASDAHPAQMSTETITTQSASGAKVSTSAQFQAGSLAKTGTINALGFVSAVYNVGSATPGFPVKVTSLATKGTQRATCVTVFTPVGKVAALPGTTQVTRTTEIAGTIGIAWSEADGRGLPITGWKVSRDGSDSHGTGAWSTVLPASANQFFFESLNVANSYTVSVAAITAAGTGPATSRTIKDDTLSPTFGTPCGTAGQTTDAFGYAVCDGFEYIGFQEIAIYNVNAKLVSGGVLVTYTGDSAPGYIKYQPGPVSAQIAIRGSFDQLGAGSNTFVDPVDVAGPVVKEQIIPGAFKKGRATFTVEGMSPAPGVTVESTEVIGVNVG